MTELRFDERVAVVTGAGRGIGRAHARLLAARGAQVVVNDTGASVNGEGLDPAVAQAVVDEITAAGGIAVADHHDVATDDGSAAIVQRAIDEFGRIDIVVNNAGMLRDKTFHNMTSEMFDHVISVHLRGAFGVSRAAYPHMRAQGYGRIVMTSSPAGTYGNFGQVNYSSAKMGLIGMARTISTEGARYDVKANVVSPSARTRMTEELVGAMAPYMDPELVAPVVAYLCHESCSVAGEVFMAGAGRVARVFVGETDGWFSLTMTPEDVAEHLDKILDETGYTVPKSVADGSVLISRNLPL